MANAGKRSPSTFKNVDTSTKGQFFLAKGWPISMLIFLFFLLFWETGVYFQQISTLFFPAPSAILNTFFTLLKSGQLLSDLSFTLFRFIVGMLSGSIGGLLLGLLMGWSQTARKIIDPFVAAIHPLPKIALLPLVMVFFGIGELSKIVLVALVAFFPMIINTILGVRQVNATHIAVARNYGATEFGILKKVIIPSSLPMIIAGFRLAINSALVVTISVELLAAKKGLGAAIWLSWQTLRMTDLYVMILVTGLIGVILNQFLIWLEKKLVHWQ